MKSLFNRLNPPEAHDLDRKKVSLFYKCEACGRVGNITLFEDATTVAFANTLKHDHNENTKCIFNITNIVVYLDDPSSVH